MSIYCNKDQEICFTDLPLHSVLSEWLKKNVQIPHCTATWLSQIGLFLLTWYVVKFALKAFFTLTWPIMIVLCGYMAIQMLRMSGVAFIHFYLDEFYFWMISAGLRILNYFNCTVDPRGPLLYPPPF